MAWVNEQEQAHKRRTFHSDEEFMDALGVSEERIACIMALPVEADPREYDDVEV